MKIITWNVNSIKIRYPLVQELIEKHNPDILLLQELKCEKNNFPYDELSTVESYNCYVEGQKTYNGVAILSKFPADEIKSNFPNNPCQDQARFLEITCKTKIGFSRIVSLYAPNGAEPDSEKFRMKLAFYDAFIEYIKSIKTYDEALIIGGDFNIAPFDIDVYSPELLTNSTCFTQIEKEKMRSLLNIQLYDMYRFFNPNKSEFSWWDYRGLALKQNQGLRIDSILASSLAAEHFQNSIIDCEFRTRQKPSDHAPVILS